jgi:hypothetical protein
MRIDSRLPVSFIILNGRCVFFRCLLLASFFVFVSFGRRQELRVGLEDFVDFFWVVLGWIF